MSQTDDILSSFMEHKNFTLEKLYNLFPLIHKGSIRRIIYSLRDKGCLKYSEEEKCYILSNDYDVSKLLEENISLKKQLDMSNRTQVTDYTFSGDLLRFGVISDSHLGSTQENIPLLQAAYDTFEREGITKVFHAGDISDGEHMRPGHEYELKIIGFDRQTDYIVNEYPYKESIETVFLGGNHDESFWKHSGADIGLQIAKHRSDMIYVGMLEADINLITSSNSITLRLWHPLLGSAYAISYHPQRYIESLSGGSKPDLLVIGNFHKAEWLFYRNIHTIQPGCTQFQTRWMRGKRISVQMGFCIVELLVNNQGISRLKFEFFPDYNS